MKRISIIGIGSPFGQDQLGWHILDQLRHDLTEESNMHEIRFIQSDRPGLRLLDLIKDTDTAILVDAIDNKNRTGQILKLDRADLLTTEHVLSSHALGVSEALSLGDALGDLPAKLVLFGVCVDGRDPEPAYHAAQLAQLCDSIRDYVASC